MKLMHTNTLRSVARAGLVLVLALGLLGAVRADEDEESLHVSPREMQAKVTVVTAATGALPITLKGEGSFVFSRQAPASISARTASVVERVDVRESQDVRRGQVVARLDARSARSTLARARAALDAATAELQAALAGGLDLEQAELDRAARQGRLAAEQAIREASRQAALLAEKLASEKAVSLARQAQADAEENLRTAQEKARLFRTSGRAAELSRLRAAVDQARADVEAARRDVEYCTLLAPESGRIARLTLQPGEKVDPGQVVAQVVAPANTVLRLYLAPEDANAVRSGCAATATPLGATVPWSGRVNTVADELDPDTGLVPVEIRLDPHHSRSPRVGEFVFAEITTSHSASGLLVPVSSLSSDDNGFHVYSVDEKDIAHLVPVEVLARNAGEAVVRGEGLDAGARVITDGNYNLPDGAHVVEVKGPAQVLEVNEK